MIDRVGGLRSSMRQGGVFPLSVLFGLNLVDELDRSAFMALAPEIRDALGISDAAIVSIGTLGFGGIVLVAMPIGYLADRTNRVAVSVAAALLWSVAAVATGLATTAAVLLIARFTGSAGRLVNDNIHPSLLSDLYPSSSLPLVTAFHRSATHIGTLIAGPLVGVAAAIVGWRLTFIASTIPTVALVVLALRLKDPRLTIGADGINAGDRQTFSTAFSALRGISTLRRVWAAAFVYGGAFIPFLTSLLSLFFEQRHGFGPEQRGLVLGLFGLGGLLGLFLGSSAVPAGRKRAGSGWLAGLLGLSFAAFGATVALMASIPSAWAAVAFVFAAGIASSLYLPAYSTLVALITTSHLRSQGYTHVFFFYALGAIIFSQVVARLTEVAGTAVTCGLLGALAIVAGAVAASSARSVEADTIAPQEAAPAI